MRAEAPPLVETLPPGQRARRQAIVAAALRLLRGQDYEQIQMRDVAVEANVAIGTVYRYFQSKEHLFAEVLAEWAGTLRRGVDRAPLAGTTNAERLRDVLHRSVRAFQSKPQLVRVLMTLEASDDPFANEIFTRMNASTTRIYGEAIIGIPDEVATIVLKVAGATLDLLLRQWVMGRVPIAEVYEQLGQAVDVLLPVTGCGHDH